MKRLIFVGTLLACLGLAIGCGPKNPNLSPQAQIAQTADHVVQRIHELQNAATQANARGSLSDETTRVIVHFCGEAAATLKAAPLGWYATVNTAWTGAKQQIGGAANKPELAVAIAAVDAILLALGDQ